MKALRSESLPAAPENRFALRGSVPLWLRRYAYRLIARELGAVCRYFDRVVQWDPLPVDDGLLFSLVEAEDKRIARPGDADEAEGDLVVYLLNGNLNASQDVYALLGEVRSHMNRDSRIAVVLYNPYLSWVFRVVKGLGIRREKWPTTYLTHTDLRNLATLSEFEVTRVRPVVHFPFRWLGIGPLLNGLLANLPLVRWASLAEVAILRPRLAEKRSPTLSIIVPARNEQGNLAALLPRLVGFTGVDIEIVFVEGHSTDGTWDAIQQLIAAYRGPMTLKGYQQTGRGKKDAVNCGIARATKDLIAILDADLTMPPELLVRFYQAYCRGQGDLINGNRLLYQMESDAMRFLNWLGNIFFGKALSFVLSTPISDSLCGTKLFSRRHYRAMRRWYDAFGDRDPFGDFQFLFSAAAMGLGITDLAVPYRARTYGTTNILRFRDGLKLLRMTAHGLWRIKWGRG